eukprot:scaffold100034_cov69-Phaeocystis_antarctica.AAC.3
MPAATNWQPTVAHAAPAMPIARGPRTSTASPTTLTTDARSVASVGLAESLAPRHEAWLGLGPGSGIGPGSFGAGARGLRGHEDEGRREGERADPDIRLARCPQRRRRSGGRRAASRARRRAGERGGQRHSVDDRPDRQREAEGDHAADGKRADHRDGRGAFDALLVTAAEGGGDRVGRADADEDHQPRERVADGARRPERRQLHRGDLPDDRGVDEREERRAKVYGHRADGELEQLEEGRRCACGCLHRHEQRSARRHGRMQQSRSRCDVRRQPRQWLNEGALGAMGRSRERDTQREHHTLRLRRAFVPRARVPARRLWQGGKADQNARQVYVTRLVTPRHMPQPRWRT